MGGRSAATLVFLLPPEIFREGENIFCEGDFLKREGESGEIVSRRKSWRSFGKSWWRVGRRNYLISWCYRDPSLRSGWQNKDKDDTEKMVWWQEWREGGRSPATRYELCIWLLSVGDRSVCNSCHSYVEKRYKAYRDKITNLTATRLVILLR